MPRIGETPRVDQLVEVDRVHRAVYTDDMIFEQEIAHIFGHSWLFVGHESQVPEAGSYFTTTLAGQPMVMVRQRDGSIKVLHNRCGHRGALVVNARMGKAHKFNCIYHGWTFDTDGCLLHVPLESGYDGTRFKMCDPQFGMPAAAATESYKGFVFARLAGDGPALVDFLGGVRDVIDHLVELSPTGRIEVRGNSFRSIYPCNWKIYLENLHDGVHPKFVHTSSVVASSKVRSELENSASGTEDDDFVLGVIAANGQSFGDMDKLQVHAYPNGHSSMRGFRKSVTDSGPFETLRDQLAERHGAEKSDEILARNWHNMCVYPNLSMHPGFMQLRVLTPLSTKKTMVEVWCMRLVGAPDEIYRRAIMYANTVHAPSSVIKPDDLEAYQRVQAGLQTDSADWVSNHRRAGREDVGEGVKTDSALSEHYIRNQYEAWATYMAETDHA